MSRLEDRLAGLGTMSPAQLRSEWRQLFRASPPAIGPTLLALGIAYRLQEKATGGLPTAHVRELARLSKQAAKGSLELMVGSGRGLTIRCTASRSPGPGPPSSGERSLEPQASAHRPGGASAARRGRWRGKTRH